MSESQFEKLLKTLKKRDTDIERLRAENQRLWDAVNDLLESAQGGKYGEIICDADDFAAVEKLIGTQTV